MKPVYFLIIFLTAFLNTNCSKEDETKPTDKENTNQNYFNIVFGEHTINKVIHSREECSVDIDGDKSYDVSFYYQTFVYTRECLNPYPDSVEWNGCPDEVYHVLSPSVLNSRFYFQYDNYILNKTSDFDYINLKWDDLGNAMPFLPGEKTEGFYPFMRVKDSLNVNYGWFHLKFDGSSTWEITKYAIFDSI